MNHVEIVASASCRWFHRHHWQDANATSQSDSHVAGWPEGEINLVAARDALLRCHTKVTARTLLDDSLRV